MTGLQTNDKNEKGQNNKENEAEKDAGESEWDNLYDDSGKSLVKAIENLNIKNSESIKKPENKEEAEEPNVEKKKINYYNFEPKKSVKPPESNDKSEDEFVFDSQFSHIIEIYDFPTTFKNENILSAFKDCIGNDNFSLKWVDDTHCLGIFSNEAEALKALNIGNALLKTRPISEASQEGKRLAQRRIDRLRPYKPRPQTSSLIAGRLIGASLGLNNLMSKEKIDSEKKKIELARDKRIKERDTKEAVWNGK